MASSDIEELYEINDLSAKKKTMIFFSSISGSLKRCHPNSIIHQMNRLIIFSLTMPKIVTIGNFFADRASFFEYKVFRRGHRFEGVC